MKENLELKIYEAMLLIDKHTPEIFPILKNCKIVSDINHPSASIGISKKGHIVMTIKESWIESFNTYNLAALIEHETLHLVLSHLTDAKNTMPDKKTANVAMDSIINDIGKFFSDRKKLNSELQAGVYLDKINKQLGTNFTSNNNTVKEIYDALTQESEKNKESLNSFDEGMNEIGDDENEGDENEGHGELANNEAIEQAAASLSSKLVESLALDSESLENFAKSYGSKSSDMRLFSEKLAKAKKDAYVHAALSRFVTSCIRGKISTIKKPSRRYPELPYGRKNDKMQKLLLAVDTSGSMMDDYTLEKMAYCVATATSAGFEVDLICGDTEKKGTFKNIPKNFDLATNLVGGGGTELGFIFDEKLSDYDGVVTVTDGYFDQSVIPKKHAHKLLFLMTEKNEISGFKCVILK